MKTNNKFIFSLLIGAAAGAVYGFLFTTKKGRYLREDIAYSAKRAAYNIKEKTMQGVDMIAEKTSDISGQFRTNTEDIADEFKGGFGRAKSTARQYVEKTDKRKK
ncbi:MAG: YtxH domain-containing protein [Bacteroidetes bacterium]|nr:YtxH domain-containing protein [Bacteroidota bacterium]HET6244736.1 YtxH domain-containing protein [Bacteroidia bacterium]